MHALLSPSGASRWLACPPSARLEETYPSTTNTAAEEGTLAHALSELYIRNNLKQLKAIDYNRELKKIKNHQLYNNELNGHALDYATHILEKVHERPGALVFVEDKIDLTKYVPEGFGTADCIIISDGLLDLNDLKYGKGVLVEAHENKQLMLYALGALQKYSLLYHIELVQMSIYQPRLNNYATFEMLAQDLILWGESYVKPAAKKAFDGKGEYTPGAHCKFCKARNQCKALADMNMSLAKFAFEDPNKLSDLDMKEILEKAADFKTWLSNITAYALQEAVLNDKQWPGFKLVAGKSNRQYINETEILKVLAKKVKDKGLYLTEPKLVGITTLEKNIGKGEIDTLIGKYIVKPPGAATLVPDWDKRPALSSAESAKVAFDNIETE